MRRGSDYDELLRFGFVYARADDIAEWRADIRAQVRADELRVRTFVVNAETSLVSAHLTRKLTDEERFELMREGMSGFSWVDDEATRRAKLHGHKPSQWRTEEKKSAALCVQCGATLYVDVASDPPVLDGTAYEVECPQAP